MSVYLADVAMHAGIGGVFACTGTCARYLCRHRLHQIAVGAAFILAESAVMVKVIG